jgi:hypothetical protein
MASLNHRKFHFQILTTSAKQLELANRADIQNAPVGNPDNFVQVEPIGIGAAGEVLITSYAFVLTDVSGISGVVPGKYFVFDHIASYKVFGLDNPSRVDLAELVLFHVGLHTLSVNRYFRSQGSSFGITIPSIEVIYGWL